MATSIQVKEVEPQLAAAVDYETSMDEMGQSMGAVFGEVMSAIGQSGAAPAGMPFSMYPKMEPDPAGKWEVISGFPVSRSVPEQGRVKTVELPGGTVAIATHMGPYDTLGKTYQAMEQEIANQGYRPAGPMREYYFNDPTQEPDPAKWRTDIYWPVSK